VYKSIRKILFTLFLQFNQILSVFYTESNLVQLMGDIESAKRPLRAGCPLYQKSKRIRLAMQSLSHEYPKLQNDCFSDVVLRKQKCRQLEGLII